MRRRSAPPMVALMLCAPGGGATTSGAAASSPSAQWTREELRPVAWRCRPGVCRTTMQTRGGRLDVTTQARAYAPHEIPGWDGGSKAGRVASSVASGLARRQGLTTDRVRIGLGTLVVSDSSVGGWQLRCSQFWVESQEVEYNRADGDHVARAARTTEGVDCRAVAASDTGAVRWRFRSGIAPDRDSVAAVYDSLVAEKSPAVSASPPMSLERVIHQGDGGLDPERGAVTRRPPLGGRRHSSCSTTNSDRMAAAPPPPPAHRAHLAPTGAPRCSYTPSTSGSATA